MTRGDGMDPGTARRIVVAAVLVEAAKADAALFASEFPGELLDGSDWDSEAFAQLEDDAKASAQELGDDAWPIYSARLRAEVEWLAACVRVPDGVLEHLAIDATIYEDDLLGALARVGLGKGEPTDRKRAAEHLGWALMDRIGATSGDGSRSVRLRARARLQANEIAKELGMRGGQ